MKRKHAQHQCGGGGSNGKKSPSTWPIYGSVGMLAVACYLNGIGGDFVHDDIPAVTLNKDVLAINPLRNVFVNDFWGTPMADENSHKSYRPLTVLTFRANYLCFGLTPVAFHLTNVALHSIASVLFTKVCLCVGGLKPQFATLAGLLFSVHPVHTEAVTGIVGRADVLACVFFLLSILAYHGYATDGKHHVWLSVTMGGLSMLAKETGVTVLLLNLAYDFYLNWPYIKRTISDVRWNRQTLRFSKRAAKVFTSTGVLLALRLAILQGSLPRFSEQDNPAAFHASIYVRFLTFCYLAAFNWWLLLCPATLSHDWQMGSVPLVTSISDTRNLATCFFFGLLMLLVVKSVCDFETLKQPTLVLGVLLLILPFLPASNLLLTVGFVVAERVLYIPSLGCILLIVHGIQITWNASIKHRQTIVCFITLLLVSSCLRTVIRNKDWKSRESLLRAGLQTIPHNAKMHYNYANFLRDSSRHELAKSHYYMSLKLWPTYASAHNNLGTILRNRNEAEKHFLAAIKYSSNHVNAHYNLGQLYRKNNKSLESEKMLKRCIDLEPNFAPAYLELARLRGPHDRTVSTLLKKVITLNPTNPYYPAKFAQWLSHKGNCKEALKFYWLSLRMSATQRDSLIGVLRILRKFGQKARHFQLLTRWHLLLRKKGNSLRPDFYLQEWRLKSELSFKIKIYSTTLHNKNSSDFEQQRREKTDKPNKWSALKNKTAHGDKSYKGKDARKDRKHSTTSDHNTETLEFSKFALLTYC
ncbi:protein O-mannosyl-transferase TMTC1-like [Cylas formicarius]|uniref:protein O-mannosyl-transferase TMTC1-like n=1 Tax=Cylas formicarius TaxID=197179 RepID=UPI0029587D4C|nr:protein O-mannosyl-transferase TMTC1-like [Cylas formicarius]XP_060533205.1 protein O-mannosyl-transferase TMTC1-like [Cylas formicarius]XP_060533206.1 protein O-mannosyl-transferase TMTC1-like [Cylas formicarius]